MTTLSTHTYSVSCVQIGRENNNGELLECYLHTQNLPAYVFYLPLNTNNLLPYIVDMRRFKRPCFMPFWKNALKCYKENLRVCQVFSYLVNMCAYGMGMIDLVVRWLLTFSVSLGANF